MSKTVVTGLIKLC